MMDVPITTAPTESPWQSLPAEIIQVIFLMACPAVPINKFGWRPADPEPPWKLQLVCKQWSSIAVSYPALWSTIDIGADRDAVTFQQLELALERSRTHRLSVTLAGTDNALYDIRAVIRLLTPHSNRMYSVVLHSTRHGGIPVFDLNAFFAHGMSNLKNLCIKELHFELPWKQITTLTLFGINKDRQRILDVLTQFASHLTSLTLKRVAFKLSATHDKTIIFRCLIELYIIECDRDFDLVIERLTCPKLKTLGVHKGGVFSGRASTIVSPISNFLQRSSCSLTLLVLRFVPSDDVLSTLQQVPMLPQLHLAFESYSDCQLNNLILSSECVVVPFLQVLKLGYVRNVALEKMIKPLEGMLGSRSEASVNFSIEETAINPDFPGSQPLQDFDLWVNTDGKEQLGVIWGDAQLGGLRSFCIANKISIKVNHQFLNDRDYLLYEDYWN